MRELISNASDALNKVRLKSLTSEDIYQKEAELEIEILLDEENRTITFKDTGIGMTKDELITNLGTIAQSGTEGFINEDMSEEERKEFIGQFGVGFYSAFLVANKVEVISRSYLPDAEPFKWISEIRSCIQCICYE